MLAIPLCVIVLIMTLWQDILLYDKKQKLNNSIKAWKESENNKIIMLTPAVASKPAPKKYRISNSQALYKLQSTPRFPR